jgi:hypothetical protein
MAQKAYRARFREGFVELEPVRRVIYRWRIGESPPWPAFFDVESVEEVDGQKVYPYPCRRIEDPVYVATRMLSTRGGHNAWWRAGDMARRCFNRAPYEPVFRGWVQNFEWAPAANAMADRDGLLLYASRLKQEWVADPESTLIVQGGTATLNWSGELIPPDDLPEAVVREEPHRGHLRLAVGHLAPNILREADPDYRQGHLSLYRLEGDITKVADYFYPYGRVVFNHYLTGGSGVVAQWHEWFLIRVYRLTDTPILSPDHNPIWPAPGWYIAHHPVPRARGDVD